MRLTRKHLLRLVHNAGVDDQHVGELGSKVHFNLNATIIVQNFTLWEFCVKTQRQKDDAYSLTQKNRVQF